MAAVNEHARGMSDEAMHNATGRHPDEWFAELDAAGATMWTHTDIARWLVEERSVDGVWAQSITVRYEQARGMRLPGQQADGTFSVGKSKTVTGDADAVLEAVVEVFTVLLGMPPASVRPEAKYPSVRWKLDGGETVLATLTRKDGKTGVAMTHSGIVSAEHLESSKPALESGLERLAERLS